MHCVPYDNTCSLLLPFPSGICGQSSRSNPNVDDPPFYPAPWFVPRYAATVAVYFNASMLKT